MATSYAVLLITGGVLIGVGLTELILRAVGQVPGVEFRIKAERLTAAPNQKVRFRSQEWDVELRINEAGFREGPIASDTATRRLVAIGDSFTMGINVNADETFAELLEADLVSRGIDVNVVNAGMVSSQPKIYRRLYRERIRSDTNVTDVIVGFYLGNDLVGPNSADEFMTSAAPESALYRAKVALGEHSALYGIAASALRDHPAIWKFAVKVGIAGAPSFDLDLYNPDQVSMTKIEYTLKLLRQFQEEVHADGKRLVVILIPTKEQIEDQYWHTFAHELGLDPNLDRWAVNRRFNSFLSHSRVTFVDLTQEPV